MVDLVDYSFLDVGIYGTSKHKINKDRLSNAILDTRPFYEYFGYSLRNDCAKALKKIFPNTPDKIGRECWETYLRRKCGLIQCSGCKNIYIIGEVLYWKCKPCTGLWAKANKEKVIDYKKKWYIDNKDDADYKANKRYNEANRRAAILHRTPIWANTNNIKDIYLKCPVGYHVDHIIPLQGKLVSGLHVDTNLQYLLASDNLKKSNKYVENM